MHLVGHLYEDYHDARSLEHKVNQLLMYIEVSIVEIHKCNTRELCVFKLCNLKLRKSESVFIFFSLVVGGMT
jgi:hypothetical protein